MFDTSRVDGSAMAVSKVAAGQRSDKGPQDAQPFVVSTLAREKRAAWSAPRGLIRPINLERRARFARIDTV